ncbi:MAG: signal peptidase II [Anaerolineales bacterium]|jgi:signal peptidase II|nr:signal peptidase II [Anaerolineales bacterium]
MNELEETPVVSVKEKTHQGRFLIFVSWALALIVLDQWTKWLARRDIPLGESSLPQWLGWLSPYARFTHIQNRGASFGMFQDGNLVFIVLTFLIVGGILYFVYKMEEYNPWMLVAGGLYLGGAVGNLIDRLLFGAVTDFISVGTFYIFNIADAGINVSVAMMLVLFWIQGRGQPSEGERQSEDEVL